MRTVTLSSAIFFLIACATCSAKTYRAERYDVKLALNPTGSLDVIETVIFDFAGGPFTYVVREISDSQTDGISAISGSMDGQPCSSDGSVCRLEITGTSPVKVRWSFREINGEKHTFVISYRADGVIRKSSSSDELIWHALPPKRAYRIDSSDVVLSFPGGSKLRESRMSGKSASVSLDGNRIKAQMAGISSDSSAVLHASFTPGSFSVSMPEWQYRRQERRRLIMTGVASAWEIALCVLLFGGFALVRYRGSSAKSETFGILTDPPGSQRPGTAAILVGSPHMQAGMLFDLAQRGILRIQESGRRFGEREFHVSLKSDMYQNALSVPERNFVRAGFPADVTAVKLSALWGRIYSKAGSIRAAITDELEMAGYVDRDRRHRKRILISTGFFSLGGALMAGFVAIARNRVTDGWWQGVLAVSGSTLFALGLVALISGGSLSNRTLAGAQLAAQWRAFANYVRSLTASKSRVPLQDLDKLLPFAAGFGLAKELLKQQDSLALPSWFAPLRTEDGADSISFMAFVGHSDSASSGGGGADGGGASGGGSSSAG